MSTPYRADNGRVMHGETLIAVMAPDHARIVVDALNARYGGETA